MKRHLQRIALFAAACVISCMAGLVPARDVKAASASEVKTTTMACSVWSAPATLEENRVKSVSTGYSVTVYPDVIQSTIGDGKTFYRTVKGNYILCKCFDAPAVQTKQVGDFTMYVWGYTTNGTPLYDVVGSTGWPQYMVDALSDSGVTPDMGDYDKAVTVARYLAKRISYDYDSTYGSTTYRALHTNKAVCQGYANTYSELMYMLGIECYFIGGYGTTNSGVTDLHAWNAVVIDGVEYYSDITWNSCLGTDQYLMISAAAMVLDHDAGNVVYTMCDTIWTEEWVITF